ncbi:c-type cytochrome [Palleronia pelagia]|uniref:Cytochrome c n=1 Tax=Palleronia pelagia TaxID=387096 RepID=A0A1H8LXH3_9RHOB|nr:cytochrome c [Palleronia pelagia]SEO09791.1 Cytochrome c [Palleronia pelagia]
MKVWIIMAAGLAAVTGAAGLLFAQADLDLPNATGDPVAGAQLYAENCASCHGANLEGQADWRSPGPDGRLPAPPHDETGHTWHHGDAMIFAYTKQGGAEAMKAAGIEDFDSGMPAFGDILSDQEIWDIMAYIKSTWPERVRDAQSARTASES